MQITENADGSVSVKSGFDEYEDKPEYVTQYHTNVDELSPAHIQTNAAIEKRNANKKALQTKAVVVAQRVAQVEQAKKEHSSWIKQYWEDVRQAAHSNSMFGSLAQEEHGFDISEAEISPINELSGNMALSRSHADSLGTSFYLTNGQEDYGMKVVEPSDYQRRIVNVQDEFGYTLVNGETLDRASLANAKSKIAKDKAKTALVKSQHVKAFANTVLHADKGPKLKSTAKPTAKTALHGLGRSWGLKAPVSPITKLREQMNDLKAQVEHLSESDPRYFPLLTKMKAIRDQIATERARYGKNQGKKHGMSGLGAVSNQQMFVKFSRVLIKVKKMREKALSLAEDSDYKFALLDKAQEISDKVEDVAVRRLGLVGASMLFSNYGLQLRNTVTTIEREPV